MAPTPAPGQLCSNCGTTKTPLWRRAPDGTLICNACGLYYRSNNAHRPVNLKRPPNKIAVSDNEGSCRGDGHCNGTGGSAACRGCPAYNNRVVIKKDTDDTDELAVRASTSPSVVGADESDMAIACFNCGTTITPLWRRDDAGNTICNACGLYYKLHKSHRPVKMKRSTIKRRKRHLSDGEPAEKAIKVLPRLTPGSPAVVKDAEKEGQDSHREGSAEGHESQNLQNGQNSQNSQNGQVSHPASRASPNPHASRQPSNPPASAAVPMFANSMPPQMGPPGFGNQGPSQFPPYVFHPYVGLRIPNGPGPVPGPPPPMGFTYTGPVQNPYMYNALAVQPGPVPGPVPAMQPMVRTPPHVGQGSTLSHALPPIKLPQLNLPRGSATTQNYKNALKSPKSPRLDKKHTPIPVDFTSSYPKTEPTDKVDRVSIGGLLNKK